MAMAPLLYLGLDVGTQVGGGWPCTCAQQHHHLQHADTLPPSPRHAPRCTRDNTRQGVKALVYDGASRAIVARGAHPWGILESDVPGRAEQHPATWVEVRCGWGRSLVQRSACLAVVAADGTPPPQLQQTPGHHPGSKAGTGPGGRQCRARRGRERAAARHGRAGRAGQGAAACQGVRVVRQPGCCCEHSQLRLCLWPTGSAVMKLSRPAGMLPN